WASVSLGGWPASWVVTSPWTARPASAARSRFACRRGAWPDAVGPIGAGDLHTARGVPEHAARPRVHARNDPPTLEILGSGAKRTHGCKGAPRAAACDGARGGGGRRARRRGAGRRRGAAAG